MVKHRQCEETPMLGHLPHLKYLCLSHLSSVKSLGSSFYGIKDDYGNKETNVVFPSLEKLELIGMERLTAWTEVELSSSSWTQVRQVLVFQRLEYLKIENCRQLNSAPSHFPCLKELEICNMESGIPLASICGSKMTTLTKLMISEVDGVVCLPDLLFNYNQYLLELNIRHCINLTHLVSSLGDGGASLRKLEISGCPNLVVLLEDVYKSIPYPSGTKSSPQGFTSLCCLEIWGCSGLTNLSCEMLESCALSLVELALWDLASLRNMQQVMSILHKMSRLTNLRLKGVPQLSDVVVEIGSLRRIINLKIDGDYVSFGRILPAFQSLHELGLYGMKELDELPEQLQHFTALHVLWIVEFGIQVLPEWLERLSSLRILTLERCKS